MPSEAINGGQKANRVTNACRNCRSRKVRCSGGSPCKDCTRLGKECIYLPLQRRRKTKDNQVTEAFEDRLASLEARLEENTGFEIGDTFRSPPLDQRKQPWQSPTIPRTNPDDGPEYRSISMSRNTREQSISHRSTNSRELESQRDLRDSPSLRINGPDDYNASRPGYGSTSRDGRSEHHEPWSWMSICSQAGSEWICKRTRNQDFVNIADRLANGMARSLTNDEALSLDSTSLEPDEATAREYVDAFFEECWEASLGIVHRSDIESCLQTHFSDQRSENDDPAWFALRNAIFAGGYRSILAKSPTTPFDMAQSKAWNYFKNALSVLTKLLIPPSNLMAIRALTLMACYIESLGNPALQHLLCSNAVHLAQTKGLHRQPERSWGLSTDDTLKRNWLWWTIYSLEKHLAISSGRPSAIYDSNLTVQIPSAVPQGSNMELESLVVANRHAQICAQISREIMSVKAIQASASELMNTANGLHHQLTQLLEGMPAYLKIGALARPTRELLSSPRFIHSLYLHFAIYGSIMAVHTHFFYPWMSSRFIREMEDAALENQILLSSTAVAEAARKIILALRLVASNAATPSWLGLSYPLYAHVNLFVHILRYPTLPSTQADLGLLDVCVGHFGYLDFLTASEISISFPRESAILASNLVKAAKLEESQCLLGASNDHQVHENDLLLADQSNMQHEENELLDPTAFNEIGNLMNFDSGTWNLFSSFDMMSASAPILGTFNAEPTSSG